MSTSGRAWEMAEISVTDTGIGTAPEDQEVVFEEFRQVGTATRKVEDAGLGLAPFDGSSSSSTEGRSA